MSDVTTEGFFDNVGGSGAPSAALKGVGDVVYGVIVSQTVLDAKKFGKDEVERDEKTGEPIKQLQVVLQTDLRNWEGVARIPLIDKDDPSKGDKPASEDDGTRAVYLKQWTNAQAAVGEAVVKATGKKGPLRDGGKLGLKVAELKDTGKGNPLKIHAAVYEPPTESADFFGGNQTPQEQAAAAPAPAPEPAPQASAPAGPVPTTQQDPWGTPPSSSTPPF